jgi:two-component system, OmpR family, sensor histidine kinase KdpD
VNGAQAVSVGRPRGRLHVYAGMCEGAGATDRMLDEGARLRASGADVVLGVLAGTPSPGIAALAESFEHVAAGSVAYRGVTVEALDIEAILARHPGVVLVDELWREHAPGMRPATRWAAVEAIRDAGIDVVATLDLGHLASLADAAATITGVAVRERLPDSVLDGADDVELVDVSPSTLRQRIADGLVVGPERATRLLDRVYTMANLAALRELALRSLTRRVEREIGESDAAGARMSAGAVAVPVDGGPGGRDAIRRAAALAGAMGLRLVAVVAETGTSRAADGGDPLSAADDVELARDLGAEVLVVPAADAGAALVAASRRVRASHVVLPARTSSLGDRLRGRSPLERLAAADPDLELHLVPVRG